MKYIDTTSIAKNLESSRKIFSLIDIGISDNPYFYSNFI